MQVHSPFDNYKLFLHSTQSFSSLPMQDLHFILQARLLIIFDKFTLTNFGVLFFIRTNRTITSNSSSITSTQ